MVKYPWVRPDKETQIQERAWMISLNAILVGGAPIYLLLLYYKLAPSETFEPIALFIALLVGAIAQHFSFKFWRSRLPDWVMDKDILGWIEFRQDGCIFHKEGQQEILLFEGISQLELRTNYYQSYRTSKGKTFHGIARIQCHYENKESITLKFLVTNRQEWERLGKVLEQWYLRKLPLVEFYEYTNTPSFLLRNDWSDKDLEAMQERFQLSKINL